MILPLAMSLGFAVLFLYGASLVPDLRREVFACRDALKLKTAPELNVLIVMLVIFAFVFVAVACGCFYILYKY
ncbi:MAG: hypothetical protein JNN20_01820 [Betaproteobacteria bacterium]|nr:hypothetical protein [Betaproteobacteria bacterium]